MKVKVTKIKRAQFELILIDTKHEENIARDKNGNALFSILNPKFIAHANGSDIKFDWFLDRAFGIWHRVTWD